MKKYNKDLTRRLNCRFTEEQANAITILSHVLHCSECDVVRICVCTFFEEHTHLKVG